MKIEPSSDHRQAAATIWQMFRAYVDEGFTETQALALCIALVQGAPRD